MIQRLLTGEAGDLGSLNYNLASFHIGLVVVGEHPQRSFFPQRGQLNSRLLSTTAHDGNTWGWFGGSLHDVEGDLDLIGRRCEGVILSCGEPAEGFDGWRLTHRQALMALPVALQKGSGVTRYPDIALLSAALRDDVLAASLRGSYLTPLEEARDGGASAKRTLRAYFSASRNASSTAAVLGVDRATVRNRLIAVEERIGRSLDAFSAELELALKLDAFEDWDQPRAADC